MRASQPITRAQTTAVVTRLREQTIPRLTADLARRRLAEIEPRQGKPYQVIVDGRRGAPIESVKPGGNIRFLFLDMGPALDAIWRRLVEGSPIGPERGLPHYYQVHWLIVDGAWVEVPDAAEAVPIRAQSLCQFVNARPYARALEFGHSMQAPDGIYELVAFWAQREFPALDIEFSFVSEGEIAVPIPWPVKATYAFPMITVRAK
jgi:hypothetical protein